ncbi:MAG: PEP-CTERM sorting domain-containing protein [Nitrosospira sp.]
MAAPVPEPGTWVMFVAGLVLLGTIAKRRTRSA